MEVKAGRVVYGGKDILNFFDHAWRQVDPIHANMALLADQLASLLFYAGSFAYLSD